MDPDLWPSGTISHGSLCLDSTRCLLHSMCHQCSQSNMRHPRLHTCCFEQATECPSVLQWGTVTVCIYEVSICNESKNTNHLKVFHAIYSFVTCCIYNCCQGWKDNFWPWFTSTSASVFLLCTFITRTIYVQSWGTCIWLEYFYPSLILQLLHYISEANIIVLFILLHLFDN